MKKITITNAYTWYNKGDAGILLGILESLKQIYSNDISIDILSFTPEEDKKRYCEDEVVNNVYSNILNPFPYKNSSIGKILAILKLILKMIYIYITTKISLKNATKKNKILKVLSESDIIVVCGGGFLGGKKYDSLMHVFQIYVNTLFKKPVIIMGTSVEPMNKGIIKRYTEKVLKKVDYIYAREEITYSYLGTFLEKTKYDMIPDFAFMLRDEPEENKKVKELKEKHESVLGITVRKWNFPNKENKELAMQNYIDSIVQTIDFFYNEKNISFVFVPQVIVKNRNDADVAKSIKDKLKNKDALEIIEDDLSPTEIKGLISNFDMFVGTRMHSNIFATSMKVPTVAIAYEKKTNGIMKMLGLEDYLIEIDNITSEKLISKIELAIKQKEEIKAKLEKQIKSIRKEIINKLEIMKKL